MSLNGNIFKEEKLQIIIFENCQTTNGTRTMEHKNNWWWWWAFSIPFERFILFVINLKDKY